MQENIGTYLAMRARLDPEQEAFVELAGDRRFNYQALNMRANQAANMATRLGIQKGDRVGVLMMNGVEYIDLFFGLAKIGIVVVPLNWRLTIAELEFILSDSGVSVLVYGAEFATMARELSQLAEGATALNTWIELGSSGEGAVNAKDYDVELALSSTSEPLINGGDEDLLYIMYTSGTTSLPKGVMHTHATQAGAAMATALTFDAEHGERMLITLPFFHVGALFSVVGSITRGFTLVSMRVFDPVVFWQTIEAEKINFSVAVPAMLIALLQTDLACSTDLTSLRYLGAGAAPVPVSLIGRYKDELNVDIVQGYGMTENCGLVCILDRPNAHLKAGSTGKAMFHMEIKIVDEQGVELPRNTPGELVSRGRHNMVGYWNRPDATAETLKDGWLWSGDIAVMDDDGYITISDRKKDMIISGGENICPAEVENVIISHANVIEVAVIGQNNEQWGEIPVAIVVADSTLEASDLIEFCDGKLARFKIPKRVEFIDTLPRNPTGKILKVKLRERFPGD